MFDYLKDYGLSTNQLTTTSHIPPVLPTNFEQ
jgi:hypothetical protein